MSTTTIPLDGSSSAARPSSHSRTRRPTSRPTTPLRPSSRSSLRESKNASVHGDGSAPLEVYEPAFAELADSMADLEANFMHLQLMHESLARFSENFAAFLYGLNMNAFCVDFPEAPIADSFKRAAAQEREDNLTRSTSSDRLNDFDGETTFMTTDTSFIDNPPTTSSKASAKRLQTPPRTRGIPAPTRGGGPGRGGAGRGIPRGGSTRGSATGVPRGRGRAFVR